MKDKSKPNVPDWVDLAKKETKSQNLDHLLWETAEGIDIKPLYTSKDTDKLKEKESLPGFMPYKRGPKAKLQNIECLSEMSGRRLCNNAGIN